MTLYTHGVFTEILDIGASAIKSKRKKSAKVKIKVDKNVAAEIIDSLGAIILDAQ